MRPNPTILVVHRDQVVRDRVSLWLAGEQFEPIVAGDGTAALAQARRNRPAVILCGETPDLGIESIMNHLAADNMTSTIPVVSMTGANGHNGSSNHHALGAAGLEDDPDALLRSVRVAIDGHFGYRNGAPVSTDLVHKNGTMPSSPDGSRGFVIGLGLATVLQMLQLEHASYLLEVTAGERHGHVRVDGGEIVDAAHETAVGEEAVYDILNWESPQIEIRDPTPYDRRIATSLAHLLMESVRRQDEAMSPLIEERPMVAEFPIPEDDSPLDPSLLSDIAAIEGLLALAVVDADFGRCWVLEETAPGQVDATVMLLTDLIRANLSAQAKVDPSESIDDILVTTAGRYHFLRLLGNVKPILVCAAFDRDRANLALIRRRFAKIEAPTIG